jgi:hypothetical protein
MRRTLSLVVVAACGSHPPPPRDPPSLAEAPSAAPDAAPVVDDKGGGLTPELVAALGGRAMIVGDFASLKLNAVERRKAQQIIAQWAKESGVNIVPPDQVEDTIQRAARGQDPTGKACGPEIDRDYAMERWIQPMGAMGELKPHVWCDDTCTLQLEIHAFALGTEFFAAPFDPSQPWEAELARRLPQLHDNGGHNRYGHLNNPTKVAGVRRTPGAQDWLLEDETYVQRPLDGSIVMCGVADLPVALLLDPDPKGTRCEPASTGRYVTDYSDKVNACVCAIATKREKVTARTFVMYPPNVRLERPKTRNGRDISAMIIGGNEYRPRGTAPWFFRDSDSVAHCFMTRTDAVERFEIGATIEFDANGVPTKTTLGDISGLLRPDERACVLAKMSTMRSPCPPTPPLGGTARISVEIHEPYGKK